MVPSGIMWSILVSCCQLQTRLDHKPEVEELERRLNVLQSRFDRQKQQLESLRHQQKVSQQRVKISASKGLKYVAVVIVHIKYTTYYQGYYKSGNLFPLLMSCYL